MRTHKCKGMQDFAPAKMRRFRLIEGVFRTSCLNWGYEEVRTPTLEYLHLFTSTGTLTPSRLEKVYSFLDWDGWSGERVVLRPEGTIPIARLYIDNMAEQEIAKLFYIANIFIFEETGEKTRERWQCGGEFIGTNSTAVDVELMVLALEVLQKLKLKGVKLRLSHAGLIRALLADFGLSPAEQTRVFDRILDGDSEVLSRARPEKPELGRAIASLLDLKGKSAGFLKNIRSLLSQDLPELTPPLNDFISIVELLEEMGVSSEIDITSGRDFEYYTGLIFQLFADNESIGGGGRYDALIPLMGSKAIPASGFALYLDRLMDLAKMDTPTTPSRQRVLVKAMSRKTEVLKEAFAIVRRLHEEGYTAGVLPGSQEPPAAGWLVEVREETPGLVLTDQESKNSLKARNISELLKIMASDG